MCVRRIVKVHAGEGLHVLFHGCDRDTGFQVKTIERGQPGLLHDAGLHLLEDQGVAHKLRHLLNTGGHHLAINRQVLADRQIHVAAEVEVGTQVVEAETQLVEAFDLQIAVVVVAKHAEHAAIAGIVRSVAQADIAA